MPAFRIINPGQKDEIQTAKDKLDALDKKANGNGNGEYFMPLPNVEDPNAALALRKSYAK